MSSTRKTYTLAKAREVSEFRLLALLIAVQGFAAEQCGAMRDVWRLATKQCGFAEFGYSAIRSVATKQR